MERRYVTAPGGKQIRGWLDVHRISFADFGELLGVNKATISHWCGGYSRPNQLDAIKIEYLTGVSRDSWWTEDEQTELRKAKLAIDRLRGAKPVKPLTAVERLQGRI